MNEIQQEVRMLLSGLLDKKVKWANYTVKDLQSLVKDDIVSVEGANAYLESIGSSGKVVINDNEVVNESGIRAVI